MTGVTGKNIERVSFNATGGRRFEVVAGPNSKYKEPKVDPAGFWSGLWHGIIIGLTFIISLFVDDVRIYELGERVSDQ